MACYLCLDEKATIKGDLRKTVHCRNCGDYEIGRDLIEDIPSKLRTDHVRRYLSYKVRQMQGGATRPILYTDTINALLENISYPRPREQADNLVRWLGNQLAQVDPAGWQEIGWPEGGSLIGALTKDGFYRIRDQLIHKDKLVEIEQVEKRKISLTFAGWERYEEIMRGYTEERLAFMAMPFDVPELEDMFKNWLKPAVDKTGFELRAVNEKPKAGLIDDRILVEIRRSRFLVAEVSDKNWNVSWEAGFAAGLGKPVFYLCEKSKFESGKGMFDTSHQHTVLWTANNFAAAMEELKAAIRNTLPTEAKMADG
ncbi:MAG: hypothetical protein HYZ11_06375 [Candidatus Tectomicrobia bacterium]|uniref:Nucleoside 2-deoxyribosyltransferase n=1 Tax=Tectimicrobiota bacterium TaxID=2528274 RepID=A0A932MPJ7_UNCTE|nr:hypothetical protein [Candidatus Tectomicrobia bacterium]